MPGAYVTIDSLDAGRLWNESPPGIGQVGCIPPNSDKGLGRFGCLPPNSDHGLGIDFASGVVAFAPVVGAALQAGGAIGAAAITADATKYAVRQQTKSDLMIALAQQKSELEQAKALVASQNLAQKEETKRTQITAKASTKKTEQVSTSVVPVLGILGLATIAAVVVLRSR